MYKVSVYSKQADRGQPGGPIPWQLDIQLVRCRIRVNLDILTDQSTWLIAGREWFICKGRAPGIEGL